MTPPAIDAHDVEPLNIHVDLTSGNYAGADFTYTQESSGISYTNSIKLLFDTKCVQCHNPSTPGRAFLDVYIREGGNDVFHNAEDSLAYIQGNFMPPQNILNASQRKLVDDWVKIYNKAE